MKEFSPKCQFNTSDIDIGYMKYPDERDIFTTSSFGNPGLTEQRIGYDSYVDTSVYPYSPEVDLTGIDETTMGEKGEACPLSIMYTEGSEIRQGALRDLLATKYPEKEYPDIHKIIQSGLLLTRFFDGKRLPRVLMAGTDRDYSSRLAYQGEHNETEVVRVNNLDMSRVTYLAQLRTSNKSPHGGEQKISFNSIYGNTMLVYDPRYVQRLGSTSSGLSYFPEGGFRALLAIVRSSFCE